MITRWGRENNPYLDYEVKRSHGLSFLIAESITLNWYSSCSPLIRGNFLFKCNPRTPLHVGMIKTLRHIILLKQVYWRYQFNKKSRSQKSNEFPVFEHIPLLPPATKLREDNVCQSFCSGGGACMPPATHALPPAAHAHMFSPRHACLQHTCPPMSCTPPPSVHAPQRILRDAVNEWTVHILLECMLVTTRKRSLGQGNIFTPVCHSVHKGGVPGQVPPSPGQVHPPGTPPGRFTPGGRYTSGRYTPPGAVHAGRYGQQAGGTHPTGMHSCFQIETIAWQMMEGAAEGGADVSTLSDSFLTTGAGQFVVEGKFSLRKRKEQFKWKWKRGTN